MSLVIGTASVTSARAVVGCGGVEPNKNVPDVWVPGGTGATEPGSGLRRAVQRGLCFVCFFSDRSHVSRKRHRWEIEVGRLLR